MFEFIKGTLEEVLDDSIIVENQNMAFKIFIPLRTMESLPGLGSFVKIFLHMNVRENDITLYGFLTKEERSMYRKLILVSGVGPKVAMGILSVHATKDIVFAIINNDINTLTKAPGIGKKTAQRLILELKDKLKKDQDGLTLNTENTRGKISNKAEAVEALISLGYQSSEAHKAISAIYIDGLSVEELLKKALKVLAIN